MPRFATLLPGFALAAAALAAAAPAPAKAAPAREADRLYAEGSRCFRRGRLDQAQDRFERLARLEPRSALAWYWLGLARGARGDYRAAADAERLAVGHDADFGPAYCVLALDLRQAGKSRVLAEWAARQALKVLPAYAGAWNLLGMLEEDARRFGDAEGSYREAVRLDPGYGGAWENLGQLRELRGRDDEALDDYGRALAAAPSNGDVRQRRAELRLERGRLEAARADYRALLDLKDWAPEAWWGLRQVDHAERRDDAARRDLKRYFEAQRRRDREQERLEDREAAQGVQEPSPYMPDAPGLPDFASAGGAP